MRTFFTVLICAFYEGYYRLAMYIRNATNEHKSSECAYKCVINEHKVYKRLYKDVPLLSRCRYSVNLDTGGYRLFEEVLIEDDVVYEEYYG